MASRPPLKLAVFGNPVAQSLSPRIHGLFADQCRLNIDYRAIEATPETFPERVAELAASGGRGCNITAPLKHHAWKLAGSCSESASLARAANTLVFSGGGVNPLDWYADSTDGEGLVSDLKKHPGCRLGDARVCLIGAGGAAASVLGALLSARPATIYIANRTPDRAAALVRSHARLGMLESGSPADLDSVAPFDLVINATSAGHGGSAIRLSRDWFTTRGFCYDMNYGAAAKPLRIFCLEQGIAYADGLGMLVGQAALSFRLWTGFSPDTAAVLEVLRQGAAGDPPTPVG